MKANNGEKRNTTVYLRRMPGGRKIAAVLLSFAGTLAFPWMFSAEREPLVFTNSIISVFLFLALFFLLNKIFQFDFLGKRRRWFWPGCVGSLFSLCMVFGTQLDGRGSVSFKSISMWSSILILAGIFTLVIRYFWELLSLGRRGERKESLKTFREKESSPGEKRSISGLLLNAGLILLCFLPVFLAVYPGFFVYDAQEEYMQVVTRNFSTHHPLIHVLLLGGIIQLIYKLTGSYNLGIACYTILQMTVMSVIFAWCIKKLRERGMGKAGGILLTLYFGLCPVLVMFSLCSAKDGLFTGMLLISVLLLQELCRGPEAFWKGKGAAVLLGASLLGMMLLRHNGFYAFLVFAAVLMVYLWKYTEKQKEEKTSGIMKKTAVLLLMVVVSYLAVSTALMMLLHADDSENQEILTVPISQVARVYADEKDSLPKEEKEILYRYLPEEALARYTPKVTDGVKFYFNNEAFAADKGGFFKLWAGWGLKHPFTYLNAWFMTSYGFWYPDTVIDVYRGNRVFTFTYEDSSYFGYEVEEPGKRDSKLPGLNELYRRMSLEIFQQKVPVVSMLFAPGFLFWVMVFIMGYFCYHGDLIRVMPFVLPLLCWMTVILGPACLVRYVVFLWVMAPLLLRELYCSVNAFAGAVPSSGEK